MVPDAHASRPIGEQAMDNRAQQLGANSVALPTLSVKDADDRISIAWFRATNVRYHDRNVGAAAGVSVMTQNDGAARPGPDRP